MNEQGRNERPTVYRAGFLAPFVTATIGTFALLGTTVIRSWTSLSIAFAASLAVGLVAGLIAALLGRLENR